MSSTEVFSFGEFDHQVNEARKSFRHLAEPQRREIEEVVGLLFSFLRSVGKFMSREEWAGSREEDVLMILIRAFQTTMGMLYLSESGFYDLALSLKRNYSELLLQGIAIGYDEDLHVRWKHHRSPFDDFHKIAKEIEGRRSSVGDVRADLARTLSGYWNESSALHSHQLWKNAVHDVLKGESFHLGPKIANEDFEARRLRTVRNMSLNILSLLVQTFDYGTHTEARKERFPEAPQLIAMLNKVLLRTEKLSEPTA